MPKSKPQTLYEVLNVAPGADAVAIKAAYRQLARELHPDKTLRDAHAVREHKANRFKEMGAAYTVLSDPIARARYDEGLKMVAGVGVGGGKKVKAGEKRDLTSKRFDEFMTRLSQEGVNKGNAGAMMDEFFSMASDFKTESEARAQRFQDSMEKKKGATEIVDLIDDFFGFSQKRKE